MSEKKYVTYEEFGAVGDGVTEDFAAIKAAHDYANEHGLPVIADGSKTYYICDTRINGKVEIITIKTDVDWNGAKIIIDDTELDAWDKTNRHNSNVFRIASDYELKTLSRANEEDSKLLKSLGAVGEKLGTKNIPLNLGYPALINLFDEDDRVYKRKGYSSAGGMTKHEVILLDKDGNVDESTPFMFDYDQVTKIDIHRTDVKPITVKNAEIITRASRYSTFDYNTKGEFVIKAYFARGLSVSRSYTTVEGVKHYVENEITIQENIASNFHYGGSAYGGFFNGSFANEITFKDCILTGRRCYRTPAGLTNYNGTMGTYDFGAGNVNKIRLINCIQSNFYVDNTTAKVPTADSKPENIVFSMSTAPGTGARICWGIGGTNFCKNMEYIGCTLSRFDAHCGLLNGKIIDCNINFVAAVGKGTLQIENTKWLSPGEGVVNNSFIYLRDDYGSPWNGTISIKDCVLENSDGDTNLVFHNYANWYFGYTCYFPNLDIDNLTLTNTKEGNKFNLFRPHNWDGVDVKGETIDGVTKNENPVVPPKFITIKNNKAGHVFSVAKREFFENTDFSGCDEGVLKFE